MPETPTPAPTPLPTPIPPPVVARLSGLWASVREAARIRIHQAEAALETAELVEQEADAGLHTLDHVLGDNTPPKS